MNSQGSKARGSKRKDSPGSGRPFQPPTQTIAALPSNPAFVYALRTVTEAAARAVFDWIGRGDKEQGDGAAVDAMREALIRIGLNGSVVIGEGAKDEAPELYNGEVFGNADDPNAFDIAVDPVEGTGYMAKGMSNSMAVIAVAPRGSLFNPGPAFYMDKFAAPPAARGKIDPEAPVADKLSALAKALGKKVNELTIYVLEKPRHKELIAAIYNSGARVNLHTAGDVAGALMAAMPDSGVDALMGTGGTPEGVISACAIRALGGEFMGRLDPQLPSEKAAVLKVGLNTLRWYGRDELVNSDHVFFCATGITSGMLFEGVERGPGQEKTQTLVITGHAHERMLITAYHDRDE
ncbi:MAG: class II fructose-bisphosphatase [Deltaproteobacteria bacterium]|nr:class II fructose-bisphosphatase [Deltaproteobacteria bacterium]